MPIARPRMRPPWDCESVVLSFVVGGDGDGEDGDGGGGDGGGGEGASNAMDSTTVSLTTVSVTLSESERSVIGVFVICLLYTSDAADE